MFVILGRKEKKPRNLIIVFLIDIFLTRLLVLKAKLKYLEK